MTISPQSGLEEWYQAVTDVALYGGQNLNGLKSLTVSEFRVLHEKLLEKLNA